MTDRTEEEIQRGLAAERLFNDPMLKEAFAVVAAHITGQWATTDPADTKGREYLYTQIQTVDAVREHLRRVVTTGQMAAAEVRRRTATEAIRARIGAARDFL